VVGNDCKLYERFSGVRKGMSKIKTSGGLEVILEKKARKKKKTE